MAKVNPIRWSAKYQDDETDLIYYGRRYLKTSTGSWLSRDPIAERGGINLYAFVRNDSLDRIDKLGLYSASSSGGTLHVSDDEHQNYLIFQLQCAPGYIVANINVIYDKAAMYHGLWTEFEQGPDAADYSSESAYTAHVNDILNDTFGGQVPPTPQGNCAGDNVEEHAYMRTRLVSEGYEATFYRIGADLPGDIGDTQQLYVNHTRIDYECQACCKMMHVTE